MTQPVRIPADVDREDRVLANLTARQLAILAVTGIVLYGGWTLTRGAIPLPVFLIIAVPIGVTAAVLALGQRDGISLDRLLAAAVRQRLQPRHRVAAPEGVRPAPEWLTSQVAASRTTGDTEISPAALRLPAEGVTEAGVVDLGADGLAVVAVASTVNFALRTPGEQEALVASFGRYLHSLTAPVQVLVRAERLDLSAQIAELRAAAAGLPHPVLEAAAVEHADYLVQLAAPTCCAARCCSCCASRCASPARPTGSGAPRRWLCCGATPRARTSRGNRGRAARRGSPAGASPRRSDRTAVPAGIVVTPLDAGQATAVLASACNPDSLLPPRPGWPAPTRSSPPQPTDALRRPASSRTRHDADDWDRRRRV